MKVYDAQHIRNVALVGHGANRSTLAFSLGSQPTAWDAAADAPPRDLEMLDERVRSRLSGGLVVPISAFDHELRRDIVQRQTPPRSRLDRSGAIQYA